MLVGALVRERRIFISSVQFCPEGDCQTPEQLHLSLCECVTVTAGGEVARERVKRAKESGILPWLEPGNGRIGIRFHLGVL
jgi:hypothetical protein